MDEITYEILNKMQMPKIQLIPLVDFERDDPDLLKSKSNRSLVEYYFTCTPSLPIYVMNHSFEVEIITYLDADLYFFSSIEPVFQELGTGSVLIIGHRFPPHLKDNEQYGIYNVGLISFRKDTNGLACLHWWRDRCLEWCYDRLEDGRFADQKYLDDWPEMFSGVVVLQHKGVGLAPWNLANYLYLTENSEVMVDGQPIIMYHFHGLKRINRWIYDTNVMESQTRLPDLVKKRLYFPYVDELHQVNQNLEKIKGIFSTKNQSIRIPNDKQISIKRNISKILNFVKSPKKYYQKFVNNDLILHN